MDNVNKDLRLAVLIDADNVPYSYIKEMIEEIAKNGTPTIKRIYADWTKPTVSGWKNVLLENAITPIQQYSYTSGKNSSDSALIIDAMDILYSKNVDGFCIVSSDSDFTRLASRIREAGKRVYGFGEKKTPQAFVAACDRFIFTEIFVETDKAQIDKKQAPDKLRQDTKLVKLFRDAIDASSNEEGWANLGPVGSNLIKNAPEFDPRNYGYSKLSDLAIAIGLFDAKKDQTHLLLRNKSKQ